MLTGDYTQNSSRQASSLPPRPCAPGPRGSPLGPGPRSLHLDCRTGIRRSGSSLTCLRPFTVENGQQKPLVYGLANTNNAVLLYLIGGEEEGPPPKHIDYCRCEMRGASRRVCLFISAVGPSWHATPIRRMTGGKYMN